MDIKSYMFEHLVLNNNEKNTSTSSEESESDAVFLLTALFGTLNLMQSFLIT